MCCVSKSCFRAWLFLSLSKSLGCIISFHPFQVFSVFIFNPVFYFSRLFLLCPRTLYIFYPRFYALFYSFNSHFSVLNTPGPPTLFLKVLSVWLVLSFAFLVLSEWLLITLLLLEIITFFLLFLSSTVLASVVLSDFLVLVLFRVFVIEGVIALAGLILLVSFSGTDYVRTSSILKC